MAGIFSGGMSIYQCLNVGDVTTVHQGRHFSFFQEGQNFERLPRGAPGAKYEEKNWVQKHKKSLFFKFRGANAPPPASPK